MILLRDSYKVTQAGRGFKIRLPETFVRLMRLDGTAYISVQGRTMMVSKEKIHPLYHVERRLLNYTAGAYYVSLPQKYVDKNNLVKSQKMVLTLIDDSGKKLVKIRPEVKV